MLLVTEWENPERKISKNIKVMTNRPITTRFLRHERGSNTMIYGHMIKTLTQAHLLCCFLSFAMMMIGCGIAAYTAEVDSP